MHDIVREKLCEIIENHGRLVYREDKRLEGLLKDICGEYKKEINSILIAVRSGVVLEMMNDYSNGRLEILLPRLMKKLSDEFPVSEDAARWIVDSISLSLKLINSDMLVNKGLQVVVNENAKIEKTNNPIDQKIIEMKNSLSLQKWYDVIETGNEILRMNPENIEVLFMIVEASEESNNYSQAEHFLKKIIEYKKDSVEAHFKLGSIYQKIGDTDSAIIEFMEVLKIYPDRIDANIELGKLYKAQNLMTEAVEQFKKIVAMSPNNFEARLNLATTCFENSLYDDAKSEFEKIIVIMPKHSQSYFYIGMINEEKGLINEAISEYKEAISQKSDYIEAHFKLADLYVKKMMVNEAISHYKEVVRCDEKNVEAHFKLGQAYRDRE